MLKCREVAELASDYLDHDLSLRQRLAMWWHLRMCHRCSALIENLAWTIRLLREKSVTRPDPAWTDQTLRRLYRRLQEDNGEESS